MTSPNAADRSTPAAPLATPQECTDRVRLVLTGLKICLTHGRAPAVNGGGCCYWNDCGHAPRCDIRPTYHTEATDG